MKLIEKVSDIIGRFKVYITGASFYISLFNLALIIAMFKKSYNIPISSYIIVPVSICVVIFMGFLDYFFVVNAQLKHLNKKNNILKEVLEIKKMLEEKKDEV